MKHLRWRKSSYSGGTNGNCVEVAASAQGGTWHVRDSKNPDGPSLTFEPAAWARFLARVKTEL